MYQMKLAFVALCLLLSIYMESVTTIEDLVVKYYDKNISTFFLLERLNMNYSRFDMGKINCRLLKYSCERICPLDDEDTERMDEKMCYCDRLCVELGDCCFDYFLRCGDANKYQPQLPKRSCAKYDKYDISGKCDKYGYVMVTSCPLHNTDANLRFLCSARSTKADLFGMLPVSDLERKTTYKNIFCAICNQASNMTYWKFSASCQFFRSHDIPTNRSQMMALITTDPNCKWYFEPPRIQNEKKCLTFELDCLHSELGFEEPLLRDLCSFYVVPVCSYIQRKNPHCDICSGEDVSRYTYSCECAPDTREAVLPNIPSLHILFDFSSSPHSLLVGHTKTVIRNKVCAEGFVFDPFSENCAQVYFFRPMQDPGMVLSNISSSKNKSNVKVLQEENYMNCSYVMMDISSVTLLSNGSIWIPRLEKMHNNETYLINGSSLFVCVDFKHVYTEPEALASTMISPLQKITYIGCVISMISLISLLSIYIALPELRTLPGKNLISMPCSMFLYHVFFLLTGQTDKPYLCMVVSVLLHYFLLSSFCWMGVMAFDVKKTFGAKGQTRSGHSDRKTLLKYGIFAWITPAVIVVTSVTLDETNTLIIGHAKVFCWISNGKALLVVLGVPVAIILLFNVVALNLTMISIWRTQKSTRHVAVQTNQTSLPILYIKLSSAMGLTWILGFIVAFTEIEFLVYLFVILNSLQGFFIFLAFVANKRTINKVRAGWMARFHRLKNTDKTTPQSRQTYTTNKLATTAL